MDSAGSWSALRPALSANTYCALPSHVSSMAALDGLGFSAMTPVQAATIPLFLSHKDVVVQAVTGSGKTLAFLVPIVELLSKAQLRRSQVGAIVISPTRELAKQTADALAPLLGPSLSHCLLTGGNPLSDDIADYNKRGCQILVCTPGRLEDMLKNMTGWSLKQLQVLVLDEADRLLDLGFSSSLNFILSKLPKQRRTGLFSATMTEALGGLVRIGLRNPVKVNVRVVNEEGQDQIPTSLSIFYQIMDAEAKLGALLNFLKGTADRKTIVYFGTCFCVDYFGRIIESLAPTCTIYSLHGKMLQKKRSAIFAKFTAASSGVLLCTDVAARGLDVPDIDWVLQFDAPQDPKAFVHRCGRTARIGKEGSALLFLLPNEEAYVDFLAIRRIPIQPFATPLNGDVQIYEVIKQRTLEDREIYEASVKAFVSYVRYYQEHQASFIFRFKELSLASLAKLFSLLKLPRMPELKTAKFDFEPTIKSDLDIVFKDPIREKARQIRLAKKADEKEVRKRKGPSVPWSEQKERKLKRTERREKKDRKRAAIEAKEVAEKEAAEKEIDTTMRDWKEMQAEKGLKKKMKAGKLSRAEYEAAVQDLDSLE